MGMRMSMGMGMELGMGMGMSMGMGMGMVEPWSNKPPPLFPNMLAAASSSSVIQNYDSNLSSSVQSLNPGHETNAVNSSGISAGLMHHVPASPSQPPFVSSSAPPISSKATLPPTTTLLSPMPALPTPTSPQQPLPPTSQEALGADLDEANNSVQGEQSSAGNGPNYNGRSVNGTAAASLVAVTNCYMYGNATATSATYNFDNGKCFL